MDEILGVGIAAHGRDEERPHAQVTQSVGYIPPHSAEGSPDGPAVRTGIHLKRRKYQVSSINTKDLIF